MFFNSSSPVILLSTLLSMFLTLSLLPLSATILDLLILVDICAASGMSDLSTPGVWGNIHRFSGTQDLNLSMYLCDVFWLFMLLGGNVVLEVRAEILNLECPSPGPRPQQQRS